MPMTLHQEILAAVKERKEWDRRQAIWYEMTHDGIGRLTKPFPGCADMHYPLADDNMGTFRPYFASPLMSPEPLARFVGSGDAMRLSPARAQWFDYHLRQRSNYVAKQLAANDGMLRYGRGILKILWDPKGSRLSFQACLYSKIIVPGECTSIEDAPWIVHVIPMSKAAFSRSKYSGNRKSADAISGAPGGEADTGTDRDESQDYTTGVNRPEPGRVIVWEVYAKNESGVRWCAYSPTKPETMLQPWVPLDYAHGKLPFVDFPFETGEEGWLSPRGIPELLAPFEASLNKTWNEKLDAMTYFNRPIFSGDAGNSGNILLRPGQIIPNQINPIKFGEPPISFDIEMEKTRALAEQRVKAPDFGIMSKARPEGTRTAREIGEISLLTGQQADLRGFEYAIRLGRVFEQADALLVQFSKKNLRYTDSSSRQAELAEEAFAEAFEIHPAVSGEDWNRQAQRARVWQRYQTMRDNPFVNVAELTKAVFEIDEPGAVDRFFTDPGQAEADQAEDQAQELSILMMGYPAVVRDYDNDDVHLKICVDFLQKQGATGAPVDPLAKERIHSHMAAHFMKLRQKDPARAKAYMNLFNRMLQQQQQAGPNGAAPQPEEAEA